MARLMLYSHADDFVEEMFDGRDTGHAREAIASENERACGREGRKADCNEEAAGEQTQSGS